jgi:hypothetical protein
MSDLSSSEKRKLERLFGMGSGYVLGDKFSNRTFHEFAEEHTGRNIYEPQYIRDSSGSKANCLRGFWIVENNFLVAKLIAALIDYGEEMEAFKSDDPLVAECRRIVTRLSRDSPVPELDALAAAGNERDFEALAQQVREAIAKNQPETALDRLHTFVIKFVRTLCAKHGINVAQDKPLHSLFGEYVKELRRGGHLESEMTDRILKSSISVLEAFNDCFARPRNRRH